MFRFKNFGKLSEKFSRKNLKGYTPYLIVAVLLAAIIIPVWADTPTQVSTFAELKAACEAGGNIKVMADIVDEETDSLVITKDVTLDLNGHKLSKTNITGSEAGDQTRYFFNVYDGTFTINNSSNTVGEINAAGATKTANPRAVAANAREENKHPKVIVNKGVKLSATNPTITGFFNKTNYANAKGQALGVYTPNGYASDARKEPSSRTSSAEAIVNEGATLNGIRQGIYVEGYGAKVTVNGGCITGCRQAIYNGGGAEVVVNDGVFSATFRNAISNCKATATINGGTWLGMGNAAITNFDDDSYIDPKTGETKHDYPECSAKSILTVNGGTFSGNVYNDDGNTLKIYNGKFTEEVSQYLADGATGVWGGPLDRYYVVTSYEQIDTAQEFLNAVATGGSYRLGSDIVLTNYVEISKDLTLDMNGHKLSRTNITAGAKSEDGRYFLIVRNGILTINNNSGTQGQIYAAAASPQGAPRAVSAYPKADGCHAKIVVNGNVLIKGYNASGYGSAATGINGIGVFTDYESDEYASASARKRSAEVVINAGEIYGTKHGVSVEDYGAKVTINGGAVTGGRRGIVVCAGAEAVVNAGNVSGDEDGIMSEKATAVVNYGTVTGTVNAIYLYPDSDNSEYPQIAHVTEARVNDGTISGNLYPDTGTILANGGKFTADPTAYKAEGATVTQEGDYYVVKLGDGCIGTLRQLKLAINNGGEYTLGADIEIPLNYRILSAQTDLTLNMNGYTIHKTTNEVNANTRELMRVTDGTTTINGPGEIVCEAVDNPQARPRCIAASPNSGCHAKLVLNGTKGELKIADKGGTAYNINEQSSGGSSAVATWTDGVNTEGSITSTAKCEINGNVTVTSGRHTVMAEGPGCYITINGGTYNATRNAISNNWGGVVTVNGGTFTGGNSAIYNCKSTITVNGGIFTGTKSAIYNDDESQEVAPFYPSSATVPTINVSDGTFTGNIVNLTAKLPSKINISGGKYTADPTAYIEGDCTVTQKEGYYVVTPTATSSTYKVTADQEGEIPGNTITARIKVVFKDLQEALVTGINAFVNYATDVLEVVSAEKGNLPDATDPKTTYAGQVRFGLISVSGVSLEEGQYYDFGTMTFKIKQGATVGTISNLFTTEAQYTLADSEDIKVAATVGTDITVYQPVTAINVTSSTAETVMLVGSTLQLNAEVLPATAKTKDIEWISNNENVATVDANGLVTAQYISSKTASVTITAKALDGSGVIGSIQLTVNRPKVASMTFAQTSYELATNDATKNLYTELSVGPDTALKPAVNEITWQSSNPNFAIDANGVISIVTPTEEQQSTTVTAKYTNEDSQLVTATCTVSSKAPKINLNLATKLEGRQSGGGTGVNTELMEVWLYDSTNHPLWNGSGTTDAQGKLSFEIDSSTVQSGQTVKLWVKGERYLAKLFTVTVTISDKNWNVTMPDKLKGADAETENSYNSVELRDFLILRKSFAKDKGEPGYDRRADFDNNDAVELADFLILRRNFADEGDPKPQAALTMFMTAAARRGSVNTALTVMNTETAKVAEEALANSTATDEETQEEEILYAVQNATGAELKAENPATASANSSSDSNSGSSSSGGGCNAGYGAFALLFAIPLVFKKRK